MTNSRDRKKVQKEIRKTVIRISAFLGHKAVAVLPTARMSVGKGLTQMSPPQESPS